MPTVFGKTPRDSLGQKINLKDLADVRRTGFYELTVASATIKEGDGAKGHWVQLKLGLAVMNHGQPVERIYDTEFIKTNSLRLQDICFFAGLKDSDGNIICPDPVEISYIDKVTGEQRSFKEISELRNVHLYAIVEYTGERSSPNGNAYPQYNLHVCDEQGRTATEVANNMPCTTLKTMFSKLKQQSQPAQMAKPQPQQPMQMNPQPQGIASQAMQMFSQQQSFAQPQQQLSDDLPF